MSIETRDHLETSRARLAHEAGYLRRDRDRLYDALRRLENAVRDAAHLDGQEARSRAVRKLLRRVPVKPRPTRNELRNRRSR